MAAVDFPEAEPGGEMFFAQAERDVFHGHAAGVVGGAAGDLCPEARNLFDVCGPVLDLAVEDGTEKIVLADVGVKVPEQAFNGRLSTKSLK